MSFLPCGDRVLFRRQVVHHVCKGQSLPRPVTNQVQLKLGNVTTWALPLLSSFHALLRILEGVLEKEPLGRKGAGGRGARQSATLDLIKLQFWAFLALGHFRVLWGMRLLSSEGYGFHGSWQAREGGDLYGRRRRVLA